MSKKIIVKCFAEIDYAREPDQASEDAAGCDLFAADTRTILPKSVDCTPLDLRTAIPSGFYGKVFPRSAILKNHLVTCNAGVIDSGFRGKSYVLMINHHPFETFTVRTGDRIAQVVFMEKFNVGFQQVFLVNSLGKTKRGSDGFGSTDVSNIKKFKQDSDEENSNSDEEKTGSDNELEIVSETAVMEVNGEVIIDE